MIKSCSNSNLRFNLVLFRGNTLIRYTRFHPENTVKYWYNQFWLACCFNGRRRHNGIFLRRWRGVVPRWMVGVLSGRLVGVLSWGTNFWLPVVWRRRRGVGTENVLMWWGVPVQVRGWKGVRRGKRVIVSEGEGFIAGCGNGNILGRGGIGTRGVLANCMGSRCSGFRARRKIHLLRRELRLLTQGPSCWVFSMRGTFRLSPWLWLTWRGRLVSWRGRPAVTRWRRPGGVGADGSWRGCWGSGCSSSVGAGGVSRQRRGGQEVLGSHVPDHLDQFTL